MPCPNTRRSRQSRTVQVAEGLAVRLCRERSGRALAVLLAATAVLACVGCGSGKTNTRDTPQISVRVGALNVPIPVSFTRYEVHRHGQLVGIVVTDYPVKPGSPTLTKGSFPTNGVALSIGRGSTQIALPKLRLPLSLRELQGPQRHPDGDAWNGTLGFRGSYYAVSFWTGRSAPEHDRASLLRTFASIHAAG